MAGNAVWVPNDPVNLMRLDQGTTVVGNPQLIDFWKEEFAGAYVPEIMWKLAGEPKGAPCEGTRDDNRSVLFTDHRFSIGQREYFVAVKGVGTELDAYEHSPLTSNVLQSICHEPSVESALSRTNDGFHGFITGERWFGNTPYGGQAADNAMLALLASLRADKNEIAGFYICPILAAVRLPKAIEDIASSFYWYRRYTGDYWQEFRLMPSNVRLYFQSPITFGVETDMAFSLFKLVSFQSCERFLENLSRSTMAALTLYARTLRHDPGRDQYLGLGYHDVWLDKDAVIASDGTLHFADLEGIEDIPARDVNGVIEQIRSQFYRNVYEVNYALEAAASATERFLALGYSRAERRRWLIEVMLRASRSDPYVRLEEDRNRVVAQIEPSVDSSELATEIELFSEVDL